MFGNSFRKLSLTAVAALAMAAFSSQPVHAQAPPDPQRGGELKCSNNVAPDVTVTASLVWTVNGTSVPVPTFACDTDATTTTLFQVDNEPVTQPGDATGWSLTITVTSKDFVPGVSGFTFSCDPDVGTFTAGDMPHIRLRCVSPTGGAATFALSRNP